MAAVGFAIIKTLVLTPAGLTGTIPELDALIVREDTVLTPESIAQLIEREMQWETHPVTEDRFDDLALVINRNRRTTHCWCLSHRLSAREIDALGDGSREQAMRALTRREHPPGVVTYRDAEPVGWCSISPRGEIPRLVSSTLIRPVDGVAVWSIICVVVRGGHRRQGVTQQLLEGAVAYAASRGAPAVEAYPVDPRGRMDVTMAFVGTRSMFEKAGFHQIGTTDAVASRMPRIIMRRDLR